MNETTARKRYLLHLLGTCRGVLVVYCVLAVSAGFEPTLLAQLALVGDPAATQPFDDDDDDDVSESAEAILPARALQLHPPPLRLHPHKLHPRHTCRCSAIASLLSEARPTAGPLPLCGIGFPLRC